MVLLTGFIAGFHWPAPRPQNSAQGPGEHTQFLTSALRINDKKRPKEGTRESET